MVWESLRINLPQPFEVSKSGKKVNEKLFFSIFLKKCLHIRSNFSNFLLTKTIDKNKFWFSQNLGKILGKFRFDSQFSPVYHEITETSPFRCRVRGAGWTGRFFIDLQLWPLIFLQPLDLQGCTVPHLKDLIHICLEPEAQGCGMTFNRFYVGSKYPYFISYRGKWLYLFCHGCSVQGQC